MLHALLRLGRIIDQINEWCGHLAAWLALLMVALGAYNAVVRYLGRYLGISLSSNAYIELQWYLFSVLFLLGSAYTLRHNGHVRVDVFYGRLAEKNRAWINLAGAVLFLMPFCVAMLFLSWPSVRNSWAVLEVSPDPGGLPRYPIKTLVLLAFGLLLLQGLAEIIRNVAILRGVTHEDPSESKGMREGV